MQLLVCGQLTYLTEFKICLHSDPIPSCEIPGGRHDTLRFGIEDPNRTLVEG